MPTAEIITIGTELLLGETLDTNTRFLARALRELGIDLFRSQTVGDNAERIAAILQEALRRADIIITTGGLGPTVDDPTRDAVARAAGVETEFRPELWEQVVNRVARYGRVAGENQRRQAYLPHGAIPIENPVGTAPAFIVEQGSKSVISLPGVPHEMETLLVRSVIPYLQKRYELHEVIKVRTLLSAGIGESRVDEMVGDLEKLTNPTVGLTAHSAVIDIRIAAKAGSIEEANTLIAGVEKEIRSRLGQVIFGADDQTLAGVTLETLKRRGFTLACVEINLLGILSESLAKTDPAIFLGGEKLELVPDNPEIMRLALEKLIAEKHGKSSSTVILGVSLFREPERSLIEIFIDLPTTTYSHSFTYGGHPQYAPRWACNMALDSLRRKLLEEKPE